MHKSRSQSKNPSFSSTLLDEIYNSIDAKNSKTQPFFFSDNMHKKQSTRTRPVLDHRERFSGSGSSSSDSNSSVFSSSDTEIMYGKKNSSRPLCFGPSRTKPRKAEDKALFYGNRGFRVSDEYSYSSGTESITRREETWGNPRMRPAKNAGKVKTPVSPGGKIVSFLNSLFNNSRNPTKTKNNPRTAANYSTDYGFVGKANDNNSSVCSSASSFSRACLNEKFQEKSSVSAKRSVKFSLNNVIVPENLNSIRKSPLCVEENDGIDGTMSMQSTLPNGWNIRKQQKKKTDDMGGRRSVEEMAREFLKDYRKNHKQNNTIKNNDGDDGDDDNASDSSSDLFELDLVGNHYDSFRDELPVYETTCAGLIL